MSKSLRHYKRRNNKTQRKRRCSGGGKNRVMMFNKGNLNGLGALLDNPHVLALHSSETCGHCKNFKPVWEKLAQRLNSEVAFAEFDPDASALAQKKLHPEVNVSGVPTIVYINKIKNKPVEYSGERTEKAVMEWLMKHSDKRIKVTIETEDKAPAAESFPDIPESLSAPVSLAPDSLSAPVSLAPDSLSAPDSFPESVSSETVSQPVSDTLSQPVSDTLSSDSVSDTLSSDSVSDAAAAFPPAEAPASVVGTIQDATAKVDKAISSTVEKAKDALTKDIDLSGLFASTPDAAPAAPAPTSLPQQAPIQTVPQVPSLGGKKRKITRRKKSKKSKKSNSKKTKKSKSKK
jgi:thioredoxin-like negative regulator of GroEL